MKVGDLIYLRNVVGKITIPAKIVCIRGKEIDVCFGEYEKGKFRGFLTYKKEQEGLMAEKKKSTPKKAKKDKMVEVIIHDKSVPIDRPERTAKLMFENDYCRIVEDYDKFHESVFYVLTEKSDTGEGHRFDDWAAVEKHAKARGYM